MDLITKLGLADRITILNYLGRATTLKKNKVRQEVRYLRTGKIVPKEHSFTKILPHKRGYIEIFGYAQMFSKNVKQYFKIFYENLVNKLLITFQECEGVGSEEKYLSHIYGTDDGNLKAKENDEVKLENKKEECLVVREINLVYKRNDLIVDQATDAHVLEDST